jgi:putative addiction module killer protein
VIRRRGFAFLPVSGVYLWGTSETLKPVGDGVSELRIDFGPGYRVYLAQRGNSLVLLLAGGSKKTQTADIAKANKLAREWGNGREWEHDA